jgi:hypothetical protein
VLFLAFFRNKHSRWVTFPKPQLMPFINPGFLFIYPKVIIIYARGLNLQKGYFLGKGEALFYFGTILEKGGLPII